MSCEPGRALTGPMRPEVSAKTLAARFDNTIEMSKVLPRQRDRSAWHRCGHARLAGGEGRAVYAVR